MEMVLIVGLEIIARTSGNAVVMFVAPVRLVFYYFDLEWMAFSEQCAKYSSALLR